jgi:hypothetical protein
MIRTTSAQFTEIQNALRNEKIWTFLIVSLFAQTPDQEKMIDLLCGEPMNMDQRIDIRFEAQPISPREGKGKYSEGNTKLDLAFGNIIPRRSTSGRIAYGPHEKDSWVCFVETKLLSDCSIAVSYDPLRNQLT